MGRIREGYSHLAREVASVRETTMRAGDADRGIAEAAKRAAVVPAAVGLALLGPGSLSPQSALAAFPGHNGQIAFQSDRDGRHPEIYTVNPDGGCVTRLTHNPSLDGFPTWSPDGRRIAFVSTRNGVTDIYVMNADGSGQTRLTDNPTFDGGSAWSPDGRGSRFEATVPAVRRSTS
jgi:dipeptidyl aminopeptidase/acylaminoacyl peptidase